MRLFTMGELYVLFTCFVICLTFCLLFSELNADEVRNIDEKKVKFYIVKWNCSSIFVLESVIYVTFETS